MLCIWIDWKFSSEFNDVRGQVESFWGQKSEIWPNSHDMPSQYSIIHRYIIEVKILTVDAVDFSSQTARDAFRIGWITGRNAFESFFDANIIANSIKIIIPRIRLSTGTVRNKELFAANQ